MDAKYFKFATSSTLAGGLVSYWKLDSNNSSQTDSVGSNTGTVTSATYTASGKLGGGYVFASGTDINCGSSTTLALSSAGTVSAWIYQTTQNATGAIAGRIDFNNDRNGYIIWIRTNNTPGGEIASAGGSIAVGDGPAISLNTWYHIVLTWDASNVTLYVNGSVDQQVSNTLGSATDGGYNFYIGDSPLYTSHFVGTIDEVGVWNRALSSGEIIDLYYSGTGKTYPF